MERELIKVKKHVINKKITKTALIVFLAICVIFVGIFVIKAIKNKDNETIVENEEIDYLETYVGPKHCDDQGEWFSPNEYYGIYDSTGTLQLSAIDAMFKQEAFKGIVPAGINITPILITYDDFEPFDSMTEYGYLNAYSCNTDDENVEIQLGISGEVNSNGSYEIEKNGATYSGNVSVSLKDINYYLINTFDEEALTTSADYQGANSSYGYLVPNLKLDYSGSFSATVSGEKNGKIEATFNGNLDSNEWSFTNFLSGQGNDHFIQGETYIRLKLPCEIKEIIDQEKKVKNSYVNVYLKLDKIQIGTRYDCMPEHLLENETVSEQ